MLNTTYDRSNKMDFKYSVGRSRTGDQLHMSYAGSSNAHCNQRMKLQPVSGSLRMRPNLFCVKCFGTDPANYNDKLVATEIIAGGA